MAGFFQYGDVNRRPLLQVLLLGLAAIALSVGTSALAAMFGYTIAALFGSVLLGMAVLYLAIGEGMAVAFIGLIVVAGAGIGIGAEQDSPLWGADVRGLSVAEAPTRPDAVTFHFRDGRVLADHAHEVPIRGTTGGHAFVLYTLYVAPLVGDGWTERDPVPAWVLSDTPYVDHDSRDDWGRPVRAGVRVTWLDQDEIGHAIERELEIGRLSAVRNAPVLRWMAEPETVIAAQRAQVWQFILVAGLIWGVVLLAGRAIRSKRA